MKQMIITLVLFFVVYAAAILTGHEVKLPEDDSLTIDTSLISSSIKDTFSETESETIEPLNQDSIQLIAVARSPELE